MSHLFRYALALAHLALAGQGLMNTFQNVSSLSTPSQIAMTATQIGYSVIGIGLCTHLLVRRRVSRTLVLSWAALLVASVAIIPAAWAPEAFESLPQIIAASIFFAGVLAWLTLKFGSQGSLRN